MININEVIETNNMISEMNLDVTTNTIGTVSYTHMKLQTILLV